MVVEAKIEKFIAKHHVLTLATARMSEGGAIEPYCANMFYVYCADKQCFIFTTDDKTRHGQEFAVNQKVAGSVVLETNIVGKIQGLQFTGEVSRVQDDELRNIYLKKYPFAALSDLNLWQVELDFMKLTDNRLGFGKKLIWTRDE